MSRRHKQRHEEKEDDVDLNPLIDVITMLIIFFLIGGKLTADVRTEQITVPPTKTATKLDAPKDWERVVVNVFGNTQIKNGEPMNQLRVGTNTYINKGIDNYDGYAKFREMLDKVFDRAAKYPDPKGTGMQLPKVLIEIRADANTQYRVVQEVQQVITDSIEPANKMLPKVPNGTTVVQRPFVSVNFTTRLPTDH